MRLALCIIIAVIAAQARLALAQDPELVMGYRTNERRPYIDDDNDEGIYKTLYSRACQKIGCTLKVVRLPKKRVLQALAQGEVDFYPGYTYNAEREPIALFLPNGLRERHVVITRASHPAVRGYADLDNSVELRSLGNPDLIPLPWQARIKVLQVPEMDVERAFRLISAGKADFYIYDELTLRFYWERLRPAGLTLHPSLEPWQAMHMGFSKHSRFYRAQPNPDYRADQPLNPDNYPLRLDPASLAGRLTAALQAMKQSGETERIVEHFLQTPAR